VEQYLAKHHSELLEELRGVVAGASLDQAGAVVTKPADDEGGQGGWPGETPPSGLNGYRQPSGEGSPGAWVS
jgi:hypothetical protein